jgi:hypothetical protein
VANLVGFFLTNWYPAGTDLVSALANQARMACQAYEDGWDAVWTVQNHSSTIAQLQPLSFVDR